MKTKVIVLACDFCSAEGEGVRTREISGERGTLEVEACARCWEKKTRSIVRVARPRRRKRRTQRRLQAV